MAERQEETLEEIRRIKARWGEKLVLLVHHYQRQEIVSVADRVGDSYELAKAAGGIATARTIVFCGVRFMAEAAEVLRRDEQRVVHPVPEAGCPMADMAPADQVQEAWDSIASGKDKSDVMPIVYMNSSAALKALVGRWGGCVCTSSNAKKAFDWALSQRASVFFFPDEHLGRNTARALRIKPDQMALFDPSLPDGGLTGEQRRRARVLLWKGYCHVHTAFTVADVEKARAEHPDAKILVHPECAEEVVKIADGSGSTSFLVKAVGEAPPGSTWVIGTEINLVSRLASSHPDRTVVPLRRSLCPNMFRTSPERLLAVLKHLEDAEPVTLPAEIKEGARLSLDRMLSLV
jgi:quinolinate synthase